MNFLKLFMLTTFLIVSSNNVFSAGSSSDSNNTKTKSLAYLSAEKLINQKQFSEAIIKLNEALATDSKDADIYNYLGFSHRKLGKMEKAAFFYKKALEMSRKNRQFVKDKTEVDINEKHLVNSAWVCPFELDEHIPYTRSIARNYGWQFKIGLTSRIGTGYVYSDKHITNEDALEEFKDYTKDLKPWMDKKPRNIKWKPNWLKNPWSDNVVAIGLSQGFIDPLESNALFMIQYSITTLVECLKRDYDAKTYNRMVNRVWQENSDYILHHYGLSNREDTSFWKEYKDMDTVSYTHLTLPTKA